MKKATSIIIFVATAGLLLSILVAVSCGSDNTTPTEADTAIEVPIEAEDLGDMYFGNRTIYRYYDYENKVLCYKIHGYSTLACVYTGQGAGYAKLD